MKFFQSPPELGDLGGLDPLKLRQKDLCVHRSFRKGGESIKLSSSPFLRGIEGA